MATAQEVAQWMLDEVMGKGELEQEAAVSDIALKFGNEFTYDNENGNLAIRQYLLAAFRISKLRGLGPRESLMEKTRVRR